MRKLYGGPTALVLALVVIGLASIDARADICDDYDSGNRHYSGHTYFTSEGVCGGAEGHYSGASTGGGVPPSAKPERA